VQFRTDGVKEESTVGALPRPDLGGTFSTASIWVSVLSSKTFVEVPFFFSSTRETVDSSVNFPCALILVSWINSAAAFIAWRRPTRIWRNFPGAKCHAQVSTEIGVRSSTLRIVFAVAMA
jgi:hypothetical protein